MGYSQNLFHPGFSILQQYTGLSGSLSVPRPLASLHQEEFEF